MLRAFEPDDEAAVISLWHACGLTRTWNDPVRDIARKVAADNGWFWIGTIDGVVMANAMVGYDGHRGWIYYLGVHPAHERRGHASQLMAETERRLRAAGCPKINLQMRSENTQATGFYRSIGFSQDDVVSFGKRLVDDTTGKS